MDYCRNVGEGDVQRVASLISTAFGSPLDECEQWVRNQGLSDLRTVSAAGSSRPDACLRRIEMGQFLGGQSVPMVGIAGVAVAPEARGNGLARSMMGRCVEEMWERGEALSVLYASTQTLYRQVGYEQAGSRVSYSVPMSELAVGRGEERAVWRTVGWDDVGSLAACYRVFATSPGQEGLLDRGEYVWKRVFEWRKRKSSVYATYDRAGNVRAYVALGIKVKDSGRHTLEIADAVYVDRAGALSVLRFLHDYASMADEAVFMMGVGGNPLLLLLDQQRWIATNKEHWMLRVVRVKDALERRGYNPAVNARLALEVEDSTLRGNSGRCVLEVQGGVGRVSGGGASGGVPTVRVGERGLAAMYSGFAPAGSLRACGLLEGDDAGVATAGAMFCGSGSPWMVDFF